ncbi:TIGR03792 family protein [Gloeobacter kilaueensis]|uniref:ABM domain-containing protein n=1 Tax=Gloeobacter kilaueensis (strain ATCC BAA-2537 / CCAP 1431/1 / ULC 316 / JS1) TaxID=1183438 RepID=U5QKL9_GLOK1|nr:TIGR03792 family protein [Gloeobacter kilaueensis]AGY58230.1 hypothetical protein GKIL_1984 [Gloeobacter kilaueensis JS1]
MIEWLQIAVEPHLRERYVEVEGAVWTAALQQYKAFVAKEVWFDPQDPAELIVWIRWTSREEWKSISPAHLSDIERRFAEQMGPGWHVARSYEYLPVRQYIGKNK